MFFVAGTKEKARRPKDVGKWCDIDYFDGLRDPRGYEDIEYDKRKGYGLSFWSDNILPQARSWIKQYNIYTYLELGCGKGWTVQAMRMQGVQAYGVDISEYAISMCHPDMKRFILCQDATDLSRWEDQYFDYVFSWDFLEHLSPEEIRKCLIECRRVCKGYMRHGVTVFDKDYGSIAEAFPGEPQDPTHVSCYRLDWWRKMLYSLFSKDEIVVFDHGKIVDRRGGLQVNFDLREKKD